MELLVLLAPLVVGASLLLWKRAAPRALVALAVALGVSAAVGLLAQARWPWPRRFEAAQAQAPSAWEAERLLQARGRLTAASAPGADHDGDGALSPAEWIAYLEARPAGWLGAGGWLAQGIVDPLSLILLLLVALVGGTALLEGARWRVSAQTLGLGFLAQGAALVAVVSGDLLLATAGAAGCAALTRALRGEGAELHRSLGVHALALGGAWLASGQLGASGWPPLGHAAPSTWAQAGLVAWLAGATGLGALLPPSLPREPARAALSTALRAGLLPMILAGLLARSAPLLAHASLASSALGWLGLLSAGCCAWIAVREPCWLRGVQALSGALAGLVLAAASWGAPSGAVLLAGAGGAALASLALAGGELALLRGSLARAELGGAKRARPAAVLTAWVALAVLAGLPPFGVYRGGGALGAALLQRGSLGAGATCALSAALALTAWAAWRLLLDLLAPRSERLVARARPEPGAGGLALALALLAAWAGALLASSSAGWQPAAVAARLSGGDPPAVHAGWLTLDPGAQAGAAVLALAALPALAGLALALWGPVERGAPATVWQGEPLREVGQRLLQLESRWRALSSRPGRWMWERVTARPASGSATEAGGLGAFGYLGPAYRDAALVALALFLAVSFAVLLS